MRSYCLFASRGSAIFVAIIIMVGFTICRRTTPCQFEYLCAFIFGCEFSIGFCFVRAKVVYSVKIRSFPCSE